MKRTARRDLLRRMGSLTLAAAVIWVIFATAGGTTLGAAFSSLAGGAGLPAALLRAQLGDRRPPSEGETAAGLVISQSPLLLGSRQEVLALQSQDDTDGQEEALPQQPIRETPEEPETELGDLSFADNGVTARTLVPTTTDGYVISGLAYINNYSNNALTATDLSGPFDAALGDTAPQVLIVHTHGSEAYTMPPGQEYQATSEYRTTDTSYNVVRVGDEIAAVLALYGISVVHDRSMYDYPQYNGAYDRSLASIESYLEKYPTISFVLDIHRDAISDSEGNPYKVISQEPEGTAAQLTLVMGSDGSGLAHERWRENVKLAAAIQNTLLEGHPTLMRPITLRNSRYNQHCTTGSLLVEVGAAGNSLDEALLAARLFAKGFAETLGARMEG